jgi:hypothetical protein
MRNRLLSLLPCLALGLALLCSAAAFAQESREVLPGPGWQVMRAEWGAGNRWMDVTSQVRMLLSGSGTVRVNNQNMGGDPAVGADKVLRIHARNFEGQSRQFSFREGGNLDTSQFYNYGGGVGEYHGPGWQVMWADYGVQHRRLDVTDRVRSLLSGNGMVRINNQNMGGDPAVGADKVLRISARDARGQVEQFSFKEGSTMDTSQFYNYAGYRGGRDRDDDDRGERRGDLRIVRAYYGLNTQTNDVTRLLQSMVRNNSLFAQVNNANMGGDPFVGADKVLTVIYRFNGQEQSATVKEGNALRIP